MNVERIIAEIAAEVRVCTECRLSETRTNAVPGEGSVTARIMFVGEGPGQREDATGRPFVGQAGKLLNQLLEQAGIPREDVFITNIVKCRPPQNRVPLADEVLACNDYLMGQIASIEPKFICPLGGAALATLLGPDLKISQVRCQVFRKSGILYVPLYHPAAALHRGALRETLFNDILRLKDLIEREIREDEIMEMGKPLEKSTFTVGSGGSEMKKNEEPKLF
jgi:DNA polymerase